jgi:signal transduction histidine kinase
MADKVALAIDNARLFRESENARRDAEQSALLAHRLQNVTASLAAATTTEEVAQAMIDVGFSSIGATGGVICRLNDDATVIEHVWQQGYPPEMVEWFRQNALEIALPPREVVRTRKSVWIENKEQWLAKFLPPAPGVEQALASAALPLYAGDRFVGVMVTRFPEERTFSAQDRRIIESVASQCAQAMERARLREAERLARQRADDANRAKTDFLAVMSHELRTPLNAIAGYAELLEMGVHGPMPAEQVEVISRIQRSQRHLLRLINDVLNFAKIDAGHVELDIADFIVHDMLASIEALLSPQLAQRQLAYAYSECSSSITAYADREKSQQIVLNLLSNAIKFTPAGGRISVSCEVTEETVEVRVSDTGCGIPADKLERIFEPFVQLEAGKTRKHEGTGLGLAISRDLARSMDGEIEVESAEGVGSTFTLRLPRGRD